MVASTTVAHADPTVMSSPVNRSRKTSQPKRRHGFVAGRPSAPSPPKIRTSGPGRGQPRERLFPAVALPGVALAVAAVAIYIIALFVAHPFSTSTYNIEASDCLPTAVSHVVDHDPWGDINRSVL